jgi:hypothetical protein
VAVIPLRATTIRWAVCPSTAAIDEIVQPGVNLNPPRPANARRPSSRPYGDGRQAASAPSGCLLTRVSATDGSPSMLSGNGVKIWRMAWMLPGLGGCVWYDIDVSVG